MPESKNNNGTGREQGPPGGGAKRPLPPRRQEYDGVIYEPSGYARPPRPLPQASSKQGPPRGAAPASRRRPSGGTRPPARKKTKTKFAVFYILTLLAAVTVCLVLFAMAFQTMTKNNPVVQEPVKPAFTLPPDMAADDFRTTFGMITAMNTQTTPQTVTLLEIESNRKSEYKVQDATDFKNRYGSPMAFSEFDIGRMVEAAFDANSLTLVSLAESSQAWEYKHKSNVRVDVEASTITVGNDIYTFGSQTLVLYQNSSYTVGKIMPMDMVSLTGYLDKVWCIRLESSHGFLRIENADKVVNGTLAVDTSTFMALEEATEPISLVEGTHRVIIEGHNIEPYIADVVIRPDETAYVNLIDVAMKKATLKVNTKSSDDETDFMIFVDGAAATETELSELTYGDHTIRVEKDGFVPVEQAVSLTKPYTEISVELIKIPKSGRLILYTTPTAAEIYIDNVFVGYSTLTYNIELGTHNVIAKKNGYYDSSINVQVDEGDNTCYLILTEVVADPYGNLSPPANTQPIETTP